MTAELKPVSSINTDLKRGDLVRLVVELFQKSTSYPAYFDCVENDHAHFCLDSNYKNHYFYKIDLSSQKSDFWIVQGSDWIANFGFTKGYVLLEKSREER